MSKNILNKFNIIYMFLLSVIYYVMLPASIYKGLPMGDTPIFEYFGYAMTRGELMYGNLFDHKGPFIFLSHYLGWTIYGEVGVKILFTIFVFFFLYFSYKIIRIFTEGHEYIIILLIVFLAYIYISERGLNVETLALPFITMALYFYIEYFEKGKFTFLRGVMLGIGCAIVFLTRANMIGLWGLMTIIFIIHNIVKKDWSLIGRYILSFAIGGFLILIPLLIYFLATGTLTDMLYQAFYVNFKYAGGEGIGKRKILIWALGVLNSLTLTFFFIAGNMLKRTSKKLIVYNIVVVVLIIVALISKRDYWHYLIVVIPLFIPYITIVIKEAFNWNLNIYKVVVMAIGMYFLYYPIITYLQNNIEIRNDYDKNVELISEYIKINSSFDDKIYAHKLTGSIYLAAERLSSTKYFFIPSISENLFIDDYEKDFENNKPKYVVLNREYIGESLVDNYISDLISKEYKKEVTYGDYEIYKLND